MKLAGLNVLMRAWLEGLAEANTGPAFASQVREALALLEALTNGGELPDRAATAARYVALTESLLSAAPNKHISRPQVASTQASLDTFWTGCLGALKAHLETSDDPPGGLS